MKKLLWRVSGTAILSLVFGMVIPAAGNAEVSVNISIPLPGLVFPAPPGLIVVPGTYVYYAPEVDAEIFFYHGYWYRPHRGGWHIATGYNGPWRTIGSHRVPRPLLHLPPGYRAVPSRHERTPYPVVQKNWRTWENERHWDHERGERAERSERGGGHRGGGHGGKGHGRH
jgi:hypothetical protein